MRPQIYQEHSDNQLLVGSVRGPVQCQGMERGHRRIAEAAIALNSAGLLALPYIVQRNDHQDALGSGAGVTEYLPDGKAAAEIRDLWRWVWTKLTEESIAHERTAVKAAG